MNEVKCFNESDIKNLTEVITTASDATKSFATGVKRLNEKGNIVKCLPEVSNFCRHLKETNAAVCKYLASVYTLLCTLATKDQKITEDTDPSFMDSIIGELKQANAECEKKYKALLEKNKLFSEMCNRAEKACSKRSNDENVKRRQSVTFGSAAALGSIFIMLVILITGRTSIVCVGLPIAAIGTVGAAFAVAAIVTVLADHFKGAAQTLSSINKNFNHLLKSIKELEEGFQKIVGISQKLNEDDNITMKAMCQKCLEMTIPVKSCIRELEALST